MDAKTQKQLEEARALFNALRLVEAYNIFRRYFDRLPFQPEKAHAEYIGMFVRCLSELGKEYELKFYVAELERWRERKKDAAIAYPLAVGYYHLSEARPNAAKALLDEILADPDATDFHAKAKMLLADYYAERGDMNACRLLIFSINENTDVTTGLLVEIWKAKVLRDEGKYSDADERLAAVFKKISAHSNWYVYFSAKVILAGSLIRQARSADAVRVIEELAAMFQGRHFKSIQLQLRWLSEQIRKHEDLDILRFSGTLEKSMVTYANKSLALRTETPADRLLLLLAKKKFVDKANIVRSLYSRPYEGERDDKLIYYHVHNLRKRLKAIGLSPKAILSEREGYRLVPEVEECFV